jgi:hypothetical protein
VLVPGAASAKHVDDDDGTASAPLLSADAVVLADKEPSADSPVADEHDNNSSANGLSLQQALLTIDFWLLFVVTTCWVGCGVRASPALRHRGWAPLLFD